MLALKLGLVAAVVLLASLAARRFGHAVSGTLSGMPMIAGPIMGFVLLQAPVEQARSIALATLVAFPAMVSHMVAFAHASKRLPWWASLFTANLVFVSLGGLLVWLELPVWAVCALAALSPVAGLRAMPSHQAKRTSLAIPGVELVLRVAAAVSLAAVIVLGASTFPAAVSGLLLALPITGNVLPCFTLRRHGFDATVELLRGFVQGMFGFVCFFVVLYATLPLLGAAAAYTLAWLAVLVLARHGYVVGLPLPRAEAGRADA